MDDLSYVNTSEPSRLPSFQPTGAVASHETQQHSLIIATIILVLILLGFWVYWLSKNYTEAQSISDLIAARESGTIVRLHSGSHLALARYQAVEEDEMESDQADI